MKNIFHLCLIITSILFCFTNSYAQSEETTKYELADTTKANQLLIEVDQLIDDNLLFPALKKVKEARTIYIQLFGNEHKSVANTWHWQGIISAYLGNITKAKSAWEKALELRLKTLGPIHVDVSKTYNNLGAMYHHEGNYKRAAEYIEKSLAILLKLNAPEDDLLKDIYFNLGQEYIKTSNFEKAELHHLRSLEIQKNLHPGEDDPILIESYIALAQCYNSKETFQKAFEFSTKSLQLYKKIKHNDLGLYAVIQETIGFTNLYTENLEKAGIHFKENLNIVLKLNGKNHNLTANAYFNIGLVEQRKGNFKQAEYYQELALEIGIKSLGKEHPNVASFYNNLAITYHYNGDYDLAIEYFNKVLYIYNKHYPNEHIDIATVHRNIGGVLNRLNRYEEAKEEFQIALDMTINLLGENSPSAAASYFTLGGVFEKLGQKENAIKNFKKSISIFEALDHPEVENLAKAYSNLGIILDDVDQFDESVSYINKAIEFYNKTSQTTNPGLILSHKGLANKYKLNSQYKKADEAFQKAIEASDFQQIEQLEDLNYLPIIIDVFIDYGNLNKTIFKKSKDLNKLKEAQLNYKYAIKIAEHQHKILNNFSSKSALTNQTYFALTNAIETNHLLYNQTTTLDYQIDNFDFAEQSKSFLLFQALQNAKAFSFANIPEYTLNEENSLRVEITHYDKLIQKNDSSSDSILSSLNNKVFDLRRQYEALKSNLETNYPDYYKAKYDLSTINLYDTQNDLLLPNQSLIEYVTGDSNSYVLLVNPDTFIVHEIPMDFPLNQWVEQFRDGLTKYHTTKGMPKSMLSQLTKDYVQQGQQLYQKLIDPIAPFLNEEIIIVPDGVLGYIPFEILLTQKPQKLTAFHTYPYLFKKHTISYCYSATLLQEMKNRKHRKNPSKESLSIAPFFEGDIATTLARIDTLDFLVTRSDTLQALPYSGDEAAKIAKITLGDQWLGTEASLDNFIKQAPDYRILHLSTHGIADDKVGDYAYLAFGHSDNRNQYEKLFIRDIYNIPLNADMVVLSACKTAYGKLQKGEGIISMARAFAYAGSKSIITSHWSVDDQSTGIIMEDFYKALAKGASKDKALRNAKLNYLETNKGLKAHPFFWAAFIGIGDMSAIQN